MLLLARTADRLSGHGDEILIARFGVHRPALRPTHDEASGGGGSVAIKEWWTFAALAVQEQVPPSPLR